MPVGAAVAAVGATAVSGAISANAQAGAAKKAANAQTAAADQANATQLAIYNDQRQLLTPSITSGAEANARRMLMLGYTPAEVKAYLQSTASAVSTPAPGTATPTSSATSAPARGGGFFRLVGNAPQAEGGAGNTGNLAANAQTGAGAGAAAPPASASGSPDYSWVDSYNPQSFLESTPGYQFQYDQGLRAIDRGAAARGRLFSGATGTAEQRYGQDYASNYWDRLFNQYGALAGEGQQNTGTTVNVAGQYGNAVNANTMAAGNARASGYINAGNAWGNFWGSTVPGAIGSGYGIASKNGWI